MKKIELINELMKLGYEHNYLAEKNVKELKALYENETTSKEILNELDESSEEGEKLTNIKKQEDAQKLKPNSHDSNWTQYVLSHFDDDELDNDNPRVEGLRRVSELLIGEIIEEGCDLISSPTMENGMRACAKAWFVFQTIDYGLKRFEALADAGPENCIGEFEKYPVAMADTRAKGRCLRAALKLRKVVAAEELSQVGDTQLKGDGKLTTGQKTAIEMLLNQTQKDLKNITKELCIDNNELDRLSYDNAQSVLKRLHQLRENN